MKELLKAMQTAIKFAEHKDNSEITSHVLLELYCWSVQTILVKNDDAYTVIMPIFL